MIELRPDCECRMRPSSFGSTDTDSPVLLSPPYRIAGILPDCRVRTASFLPFVSRRTATNVESMMLPFTQTTSRPTSLLYFDTPSRRLDEQLRDRRLFFTSTLRAAG